MKITQIGKIMPGQDGAISGGYLFRFDTDGNCFVYDMKEIHGKGEGTEEIPSVAAFRLDKADLIMPHSNAVMFGKEYYHEDDEFPLLYTNLYNTYQKCENRMEGVCAVYRVQKTDSGFTTTLVQIIEVGFVHDTDLWMSPGENDIRPYGNFVVDAENGVYYGFTMRDENRKTRVFAFDLPALSDGVTDERCGVKKVVLGKESIKDYFDTEYCNYIQGATFFDGKIYSVEGFGATEKYALPAMRVFDVNKKEQCLFVDFVEHGLDFEPEFIDFYEGRCFYSDGFGNLFTIEF